MKCLDVSLNSSRRVSEVNLSLYFILLTEHHPMDSYGVSRDIDPSILVLGTRWK
jgi:hypothetical protein